MGLFMSKDEKLIIIVGCSYLGANIAGSLAGREIVIIDSNENAFVRLPLSFEGEGIVGDAVEIFIMNSIHIERAAAVISVTGNDNTNILVAHIAKSYYHVPYVTASLHEPERERVCRDLDFNIVYPEKITAKEINDFLHVNVYTKRNSH